MTLFVDAGLAEGVIASGVASAPGTCGELAQGELGGTTVMVTCPIDMGSTATVELSDGTGCVDGPANAPKARRAVALTLEFLERRDLDARLNLETSLPRAKGMASSTADVRLPSARRRRRCGQRSRRGNRPSWRWPWSRATA